jgi:hypothetical protein
MLAVSSRSPIAPGWPARSPLWRQRGQLPAQPRDRAGSPRRPADADALGADRLVQHHLGRVGDVAQQHRQIPAGQGVGRGSSCGVTIAVLASA